jgi:translation initiation factor 5
MLNIGLPEVAKDSSYRYTMPSLVTKIEGRGNGIKTVIVNMTDVAKALHVNPAYTTKFFGIELGAQSKYNDAKERSVVNGAHQASDLQEHLQKFVELYVLCTRCHYPEIKWDVRKSAIKVDCAACGYNGVNSSNHKIISYILKQVNGVGKGKSKSKSKGKDSSDKQSRRNGKKATAPKNGEEEADPSAAASSSTSTSTIKSDAPVEWHADTSKEAIEDRKKAEMSTMVAEDTEVQRVLKQAKDENRLNSPVTVLQVFLATQERSSDEIMSELRRLQLARGFDEPTKVKLVLEALIDYKQPSEVAAQFAKHSDLLGRLCKTKNACTLFLGCIEELVAVVEPELLLRTPMILQALYESDVIEEEYMVSWFDLPPESSWLVNKEIATLVKSKAEPFIEWLKDADEESDDEE